MVQFQKVLMAALSVLTSVLLSTTAQGQWTVTNLHPVGSAESKAFAASSGLQSGYASVGGLRSASLWSGTAASHVNLNPAGSAESEALAIGGGQQAGYVRLSSASAPAHASLWTGTAASWVDLNPAGAIESSAWGVNGGQQVGYAFVSIATPHASLWSGTAASWVDLNPAVAWRSAAYATSGGQQVGGANVGGVTCASLWTGTAGSWVDLSPAGSTSSEALAIDGGQQAGYAYIGGTLHAGLWSGTAASWVDLNPVGSTMSQVSAVGAGRQAGYARVGGVYRASMWSGTAASWVDLSAYLPVGFTNSWAQGISSNGLYLFVSGYGLNIMSNRYEALLWKQPLCSAGPRIGNHPQSARTCPSGSNSFSVEATGVGAIAYQWQWRPINGQFINVIDGANNHPVTGEPMFDASGVRQVSVTMTNSVGTSTAVTGGRREIRVIVSNPCAVVVSDTALWEICRADINCDGTVDFFDYLDFVDAFSAQLAAADFNHDGSIDFFDYLDFVDAFSAGC